MVWSILVFFIIIISAFRLFALQLLLRRLRQVVVPRLRIIPLLCSGGLWSIFGYAFFIKISISSLCGVRRYYLVCCLSLKCYHIVVLLSRRRSRTRILLFFRTIIQYVFSFERFLCWSCLDASKRMGALEHLHGALCPIVILLNAQ